MPAARQNGREALQSDVTATSHLFRDSDQPADVKKSVRTFSLALLIENRFLPELLQRDNPTITTGT